MACAAHLKVLQTVTSVLTSKDVYRPIPLSGCNVMCCLCVQDVYHFQMGHGPHATWYHTKFRPYTRRFLEHVSELYELHICTFGVRLYAHTVARLIDPDEKFFSHRILSRDECFDPLSKTANLKYVHFVTDTVQTPFLVIVSAISGGFFSFMVDRRKEKTPEKEANKKGESYTMVLKEEQVLRGKHKLSPLNSLGSGYSCQF